LWFIWLVHYNPLHEIRAAIPSPQGNQKLVLPLPQLMVQPVMLIGGKLTGCTVAKGLTGDH